jgi:glycosyltransferase involved in cell wall biosynthesis
MGLADGFTRWSHEHSDEPIEVTLVTQTPAGKMDDSALPYRVVRRPSWPQLAQLFRSAEVIHVANPALQAIFLAWLLRKKVVIEHDGYQSVCPNGLLIYQPDYSICPGHFMAGNFRTCIACNSAASGTIGSIKQLAATFPRRWLASQATAHIAPTAHIGKRIALDRTQVIRHGVPSFVQPGNAPCEYGASAGRCAYVGRLVREKGVPVFLRACQQLMKSGQVFQAKIIGGGPERGNLERESAELGLQKNVQFCGSVPPDKISNLLSDVCVVVMPSIWEDVAPMVAIEQMIQGRVVIASDVGGLGELVDRFGLKFPVGDVTALAACLRTVLQKPELIKELGQRARQYALGTFSDQRTIEEHLRLYREILQSGYPETATAAGT